MGSNNFSVLITIEWKGRRHKIARQDNNNHHKHREEGKEPGQQTADRRILSLAYLHYRHIRKLPKWTAQVR